MADKVSDAWTSTSCMQTAAAPELALGPDASALRRTHFRDGLRLSATIDGFGLG